MKKNKFRRRLPGILITALLALAMLLFLWGISQTKLFPAKYLLLTGGVFLLLTLLVGLLTRDTWKTGSLVTGVIVALMILGVMAVGYFYLKDAVDTLADLTQVKVEIADVGVYVRQDDPAEDLPDAMAYQFGMLETLERFDI